jgi:hypothetical protein
MTKSDQFLTEFTSFCTVVLRSRQIFDRYSPFRMTNSGKMRRFQLFSTFSDQQINHFCVQLQFFSSLNIQRKSACAESAHHAEGLVRHRKDIYQRIFISYPISKSLQKGYFLSFFGAGYFEDIISVARLPRAIRMDRMEWIPCSGILDSTNDCLHKTRLR